MDFEHHIRLAWDRSRPHLIVLALMTLVMVVVSTLTLGLLGPVLMAGFTHAVLLMVRLDRKPQIQDLFSQMRLLLPLLVFSFIAVVVVAICFLLLVVPGIVASLLLAYFSLYLFFLVTDARLGVFEAFKTSARMVTAGNFLDHIIVAAIYVGANTLSSAFPISIPVVLPVSTAFLAAVYESLGRAPVDVHS